MAGETVITVVGNITDDPELKFTPSGAAVANFTVASTPRSFDRQSNEWKDGNPLFIRCSVWRQMAENVAESLQKGQHVIVHGALNVRQYERQDGGRGTSVEMRWRRWRWRRLRWRRRWFRRRWRQLRRRTGRRQRRWRQRQPLVAAAVRTAGWERRLGRRRSRRRAPVLIQSHPVL